MNGVSRLTAIIIASRDDIVATAGGPVSDGPSAGKWVGWITLGENDRYRPLLNTGPIYDSEKDAIKAMKALLKKIRKETKADG